LVFANVSDIIFYLGVEGEERYRFLSVNPAFYAATGLTKEQVVGRLVQEVIPEPAHELVLGKYREAIEGRKTVGWEEVSVYPSGTKHGEVSVTPVFDGTGRCTHLVGAVHDVTERRQAEEQVRLMNQELERRVEERTYALAAANQELEAFAYSVSHDLRAPLRSIDGFSQALLEDYSAALDGPAQDHLARVRAAAQRMAQLIDDLLELSRVTRAEMNPATVNLSDLAGEIAAELQASQPEREAEFVIAAGVQGHGDRGLLRAALANLLANAWKFTGRRAHTRIEFGVADSGGQRAYFVADNGAGFDMQYGYKLFGPFQRLHRADEFPGTGIGLATVQRIVRRHGGRAWAEGEPDRGATFYFTLQD
jgi:PAS domain S-box-containing protein